MVTNFALQVHRGAPNIVGYALLEVKRKHKGYSASDLLEHVWKKNYGPGPVCSPLNFPIWPAELKENLLIIIK